MGKRSSRGLHAFFSHLAFGVNPVPGFEWVALLQVNPDRTVHLLNSLFSIPFILYSIAQQLFACRGDLSSKVLPPVVELPVDAFGVRRFVTATLRADHVSHLKGFTPYMWQAMPCGRVGIATEVGRDLA